MIFSKRKVSDEVTIIKYTKKYKEELLDFIKENIDQWNYDLWQETVGVRYMEGIKENIMVRLAINRDGEIIGFSRAVLIPLDVILVVELCVKKEYIGNHVGEALLRVYNLDHNDAKLYALSKKDGYYEHLQGEHEGSVMYIPWNYLEMNYEGGEDKKDHE